MALFQPHALLSEQAQNDLWFMIYKHEFEIWRVKVSAAWKMFNNSTEVWVDYSTSSKDCKIFICFYKKN